MDDSRFRDGNPGEEFLVSIHAGDRGGDQAVPFASILSGNEVADFFDGLLVECRIADDAAAGDVFSTELELWLDEADDRAAVFEHGEDGGQDFGEGNEGEIGDGEPDFFADVCWHHVAGVELLLDDDSRVVAKFPDELVGSHIDGVDADGAALEQAVGEATGGGSDVDADPAGGVDVEGIKRAFKLESAAADVALFFFDLERGVFEELGGGLVDDAVTAADFSGENEALGLLAGVAEASGDEERVDTVFFHGVESERQAVMPVSFFSGQR